jgi:hypothetical protein
MTTRQYLTIGERTQLELISSARDARPVTGLTHNFYRYPARFSPVFVRSVIRAFTRQGDLVLDPYVGGGTSLVEACALGRHAIGVDISELAEFVTSVKTTVFTTRQLSRLEAWSATLPDLINIHRESTYSDEYAERGYYKYLEDTSRWRHRKAIEQALEGALAFRSEAMESFARCVVLRTAQWALDGRKTLPSIGEFRQTLSQYGANMIAGANALRLAVEQREKRAKISVINRTTIGLETDPIVSSAKPPKLVVTSPPYPGIHVLYHRWQVEGRKETPAPFWIANKLDGAGSSYYTMGSRCYPELATYFQNVEASMSSVAKVCDEETTIVQMVAFSEPDWQLPRYIEAMENVGLSEFFLPSLRGQHDGRLWRKVPNRRWYSDQRGETPGSQELVLFLRKRGK